MDDEIAPIGPQVIFGIDTEGRCTLSVGPGLKGLGLEQGELVGQDLYAVYPTEDYAKVLDRARAGESFTTRRVISGRHLWTTFQPVHGADGSFQGSVGVSTDMTDPLRGQEDLVKFKALADGSQDLIAIGDGEGHPLYLNPRLRGLGLPLSGDDPWGEVRALLGAARAEELQTSNAAGARWSGDVRLPLPEGEVVVHAQSFPLLTPDGEGRLGVAWIAQDITELRASEEVLQATNADLMQFRALVETSRNFIAIAGLDGTVQYVNPAGREMVGMSPDVDVTATTIMDYLTAEGIEQSLRVEQPAVIAHGHWEGESTLKRAGGTPIPVEISSFLMRDPETGEPFALATVQHDISERLAAQRAHEEFITLVAHELRTPLSSVKGYVEIASESLEERADPASIAGHLHVAARNIGRMERLVAQILRIAGENSPRPDLRRPVDLARIVVDAVESARPGVEGAGLALRLVADAPLEVPLDDEFIEVVDNLVSNAAKYTPAGGEIEVSVAKEGEMAVLRVADSGPGIAPGEREMIFQKFVRGRVLESIPGLGLGLFITRAIVHSHDGEITVDERPGGGARFVVRLPLAPAEGPRTEG